MAEDLDKKAKMFAALMEMEWDRFSMTPEQRAKERIRRFAEGEYTKREPFGGMIFPSPKDKP